MCAREGGGNVKKEERVSNKTERIFVRLTKEQKEELQRKAEEKNLTISEYVLKKLGLEK